MCLQPAGRHGVHRGGWPLPAFCQPGELHRSLQEAREAVRTPWVYLHELCGPGRRCSRRPFWSCCCMFVLCQLCGLHPGYPNCPSLPEPRSQGSAQPQRQHQRQKCETPPGCPQALWKLPKHPGSCHVSVNSALGLCQRAGASARDRHWASRAQQATSAQRIVLEGAEAHIKSLDVTILLQHDVIKSTLSGCFNKVFCSQAGPLHLKWVWL